MTRWWAFSPGDGWHTCTKAEADALIARGLDGQRVFEFEDYGADLRVVSQMRSPAMVVGPGITDEQMIELAEAIANAIGRGFPVSRSPYMKTGTIMFIETALPSIIMPMFS